MNEVRKTSESVFAPLPTPQVPVQVQCDGFKSIASTANEMTIFQSGSRPPQNSTKQIYSGHRDGQLIASDYRSLNGIKKFIRNDARNEHSAGRTATYSVTGTLGFKCMGLMTNAVVRWE